MILEWKMQNQGLKTDPSNLNTCFFGTKIIPDKRKYEGCTMAMTYYNKFLSNIEAGNLK